MTKVKKAVFPAAGFGTRFLPVTKALPKEMLPIVDKPVIQYLVEEAVNSGIEEIIIITGRGKRAIEDHFDHSFELQHTLVEKGKEALLNEVKKIENLAKFIYIRQPKPLGDGHAILCAEHLIGDEPFAVLFGDDIVDHKIPATKQLINVYEKTLSPVIGLEEINRKKSNQYGIIKPQNKKNNTYRIESFVEKPDPKDAPSNLAIIGKYILTPDIFSALKKAKAGKDGEIRLIDGFSELVKNRPIYGQKLEGTRYDTGTKIGFIKATIDFALKRKDLRKDLTAHLKNI